MRDILRIIAIFFFIAGPTCFTSDAQNPIIQTIYTADPAPMVYHDTVWLYTGHDEDKSTWFTMKDWQLFSSTDMVNWTHHASPLSLKTFSWATKDAWAGQCIYRNGKFYWYVPMNAKGLGMSIGVAVSDRPDGPFVDAIGKPLLHTGNGDIDPTVFIDGDGQAYLYWGNPYLKYVKLNEDMISFSGDVVTVPLTKEGFNVRYKDADKRPSSYEEGPWLYKRKSLYYLLYPAGGVPEHLAYSTSPTATGQWKYRDTIMTIIKKGGAFTNHPGLIDYKGKNYLFYHNGALPGGGGFTRSVCVDEFQYNKDGTIPRVEPTVAGVKAVSNLNPYKWTEAETIAWEEGVETISDNAMGMYVTDIDNDDYIKVRSVDFKKGAKFFEADVASASGGTIEIHLDSRDGDLIGTCNLKNTGNLQTWATQSFEVKKVKGVHNVYFVFKGGEGDLFNFNRWKFNAQ
jgi:arabinoxylan arabinofuranohydrolase